MIFGGRKLELFVISLIVMSQRRLPSFGIRLSPIYRKTFVKWSQDSYSSSPSSSSSSSPSSSSSSSPSSSSSSSPSSSSSSSPSSSSSLSGLHDFGENKVDLVKQQRHSGDIQQLWDEDEMDGKMRNALKLTSSNRWNEIRNAEGKYVIPFIISGQFTFQERDKIQKAMDAIANNTCVKFRPKNFNERDYVAIENQKDEGCYTQVGRMRGRQVLMLESAWNKSCGIGCLQTFPGCIEHATIIHELMHKIGLWHEHMRYDRDKHIKVHFENIPPEFHAQFRKISEYESTTYNVPYDYLSVMHYGKESGARRSGLTTMETLKNKYQNLIGTAKDASPSDYRKICAIYECSQCMGRKNKLRNNNDHNNGNKPKNPLFPSHKNGPSNCDGGDSYLRPSKIFCSLIDSAELPNLYKLLCC